MFQFDFFPKWILLFSGLILSSCAGQKHATKNDANSADQKLKEKYSGIIGVQKNEITNVALYRFIDEWYFAPYKYGGKTKAGVDCSGFVSALYSKIYNKTISGSAASLFEGCKVVSEKNLEEGDLVFFKINSDKISHVGVYLKNRHFVHASVHKGVIISSLDEDYYKKYFFKGGKVK